MSEYTLQIPDDLLSTIQQLAAQQRVSVNQFLVSMIKNNVDKPQKNLKPRQPGALAGKLKIADDFDAPLPESIASAFRGEQA